MNEQKLIELAEELEAQARGIRSTIALWNVRAGVKALNGFDTKLSNAMKLRGPRGPYKKTQKNNDEVDAVPAFTRRGKGPTGRIRRTAEELERDVKDALANGPITAPELSRIMGYSSASGVYGLIGRLKKQNLIVNGESTADGQTYVLRRQEDEPIIASNGNRPATTRKKKKKKNRWSKDEVMKRRQVTADVLDTLSDTEPRQLGGAAAQRASPLIRYGYIEKTDNGYYIKTKKAKDFDVNHA